jgi:hypothetical protein
MTRWILVQATSSGLVDFHSQRDTQDTLHMWMQMVRKTRMEPAGLANAVIAAEWP